jgi:predicted nucleotidyltransferase
VTVVHAYPTSAHERAAETITDFFALREETDAVLLTNSCARGRATPDSCLDMQVVVSPGSVERLDADFRAFAAGDEAVAGLPAAGRYSDLHLDVVDGVLEPGEITEEGIDWFEVEVGNLFVYSVPLLVRGDRLERLRERWLPYYDDGLRQERLRAARWFVLDVNLDRIPWLVDRGLHFQAFDRFYRAFQGFLLGLHISRRAYPIAYNKWIQEQVAENLGLPELYERLPCLFELDRFESRAIEARARALRDLVAAYVVD